MLLVGDFLSTMEKLPSGIANLIFTDPPYARTYINIWEPLARESARLLIDGGSLITITGNIMLPHVIKALGNHLTYFWTCAIIHKEIALVRSVNIYNSWKPVLWYTKGIQPIRKPLSDGIDPTGRMKSDHRWQQADSWAHHFIGELVGPGGLVIDPFVGSGTTGMACKKLGINFIGIDNNSNTIDIAIKRIGAL